MQITGGVGFERKILALLKADVLQLDHRASPMARGISNPGFEKLSDPEPY